MLIDLDFNYWVCGVGVLNERSNFYKRTLIDDTMEILIAHLLCCNNTDRYKQNCLIILFDLS